MIFVDHTDAAVDRAPLRAVTLWAFGRDAQLPTRHAFEHDRLFERGRVEEALDETRALGADDIALIERLDAFDGGFHAQRIGKADDRGDDLGAVLIAQCAAVDEAALDLELVERGGAQIAQGGIARAEIIERKADAE